MDRADLSCYCVYVDLFLFFKGIDITWDIEVVVVVCDLAELGYMSVFAERFSICVGLDDLGDMIFSEHVLVFDFFVSLACIDKQYIFWMSAAFFKHQDACRDACPVEDAGWQTDDGIQIVLVVDEILADMSLCSSTKECSMRHYDCHSSVVRKMMDHMRDEGIICCSLRC